MIAFAGTVPENYERHLRPILFEPYAADLATRVTGDRILEIACGTGVLTRALLAGTRQIVATDLNQAMIDVARQSIRSDRVTWQQADAMRLPFDAGEFDAIVCQFGFMFLPDKLAAFREARRVLRSGGSFVFNVWDSLATNDASRIVDRVVQAKFPADPPKFVEMPFSMHDRDEIARLVHAAGFRDVKLNAVRKIMARSAVRDFSIGMARGSPLFDQLMQRGADIDAVVDAIERALVEHRGAFGMQAIVVEAA